MIKHELPHSGNVGEVGKEQTVSLFDEGAAEPASMIFGVWKNWIGVSRDTCIYAQGTT